MVKQPGHGVQDMRQYLMIAYFYPPAGGSAVQRTSKLARYSLQHGWEPQVVTPRQLHRRNAPVDTALMEEVAHLSTVRTGRLELRYLARLLHTLGYPEWAIRSEWLLPIDSAVGWVPFAIAAAERLFKRTSPELVWTTGQPFSAHLVGYYLKQRHGIPWVADYRDPWTTNDFHADYRGDTLLSRYKSVVDGWFEPRLLHSADHNTVVVEQHRQDIIERFGVSPDRVHTVYSGYDEADFAEHAYPIEPESDVFRVSYIGAFYGHEYNPLNFLKIFRRFLATCPQPEVVRFRCIGTSADWMRAHRSDWEDVADHIELGDYVPHSEVPGLMATSTMLLLIFPRPWQVTGKVFECMRSGLPLLGLASERDTPMERMIREAGTGHVVLHEGVDAGAAILSARFEQWLRGDWQLRPNLQAVARYSRERQTQTVIDLFEDVMST